MGGKSSSSNTTNTITETLQASLQGNEGAAVVGEGNKVTITDGGAIKAMQQTADKVTEANTQAVQLWAGVTDNALQASASTTERALAEALTFAERSSRSALTFAHDAANPDQATFQKTALYIASAVGIVGAMWALRGLK